jgi:hypothetical protein
MHGIGADEDAIRTAAFQSFSGIYDQRCGFIPVIRMLQRRELVKVNGVEQLFRRVSPTETFLRAAIQVSVVMRSAFPTHAADQSDGLHGQ